jgi:small-conductance mechanosensitive channel
MKSFIRKVALFFLALSSCFSGYSENSNLNPPAASVAAQDPAQIIQFLSHTISWYRQTTVEQQLATQPSDLTFLQENRRIVDQVVELAFDYARSQAQLQARKVTKQESQSSSSNQYQGLQQAAQKADQQLQEIQSELESTRRKAQAAGGARKKTLDAQVAELEGEVGLLQARHDVLSTMLEFVSTSNTGGVVGLRAQIEELARSVPASLSHPSGTNPNETSTEPTAAANTAVLKQPPPSGIWGSTANLIRLSEKMHTLENQISASKQLSQRANEFRKPVVDNLRGLIEQGNQLFAAADTASTNQLAQETQQLDALTGQFKQISAALLPLSKISVLLDIYQRTLSSWRDAVKLEAHEEGRQLLFRLAFLGGLIGVVIGIGEIWRRTTFRYVRDVRRRYQFLLIRRVVMWVAIAVIILLTFASQVGSVVTFAGLITAGVAVALQNVIVSIVAYFFLIGKYGIRVGDRVQIGDVTGEVVDIGLVRLHIMELGGPSDSQPSGRVVAFSNSIVFQPTVGVFKQIPGTNFIWHELKLTLSSDADYNGAKQRITQAIDSALEQYRESIEAQRQGLERSLSSVSPAELRAKVGLHYTASGIEATVRFPVELGKSSEMDDHVMKEILAALEQEPKLKLIGAEMPAVKTGH